MSDHGSDGFLSRARHIEFDPACDDFALPMPYFVARPVFLQGELPGKLVGSYAAAKRALQQVVVIEPIRDQARVVILSTLLQQAYERHIRTARS